LSSVGNQYFDRPTKARGSHFWALWRENCQTMYCAFTAARNSSMLAAKHDTANNYGLFQIIGRLRVQKRITGFMWNLTSTKNSTSSRSSQQWSVTSKASIAVYCTAFFVIKSWYDTIGRHGHTYQWVATPRIINNHLLLRFQQWFLFPVRQCCIASNFI